MAGGTKASKGVDGSPAEATAGQAREPSQPTVEPLVGAAARVASSLVRGKADPLSRVVALGPARVGAEAAGSTAVVTVFAGLERGPNRTRLLSEAYRILKPGGRAILGIPARSLRNLWRVSITPDVISRELTDLSFAVELLFSRSGMLFVVAVKQPDTPSAMPCPDLTFILPALNEENSLGRMLESLTTMYPGARAIVADDGSTDATGDVAARFADRGVLFLDRSAEAIHGLTASVLDAAMRVETPFFLVMDADGQHPPERAREAVNILRSGTRVMAGARVSIEEEWPWQRRLLSSAGTAFAKAAFLLRGRNVLDYDVLGGFYGMDAAFFRGIVQDRLDARTFRLRGYRLLLDFLRIMPRGERVDQVFYRFGTRQDDASKINLRIAYESLRSALR